MKTSLPTPSCLALNQNRHAPLAACRLLGLLATATLAPALSLAEPTAPATPAVPKTATPAASDEVVALPPFFVVGETQGDRVIQGPFLAEVIGTTIYAGKKTSVIDFDSMPQIQTDNYRQAFAKTPGLLTSELSNSSLLSLSYRGIGDPHESQNLMVLKDGIPFVLDPLGYSTVYFAPPFESLDRLEFVSGGAALLYGAQPSGALNYISHAPNRTSTWNINTQHIVGSDNLYSTFSTVEGGKDKFGYLVNFDHRSGDSFRTRNSDFDLNGGDVALFFDVKSNQRITVLAESYQADHGEPGGLSVANYAANPDANLLNHDRVRLDRTLGSVGYELVGENSLWHTRVWGSEVIRYSKRQTGQGFGTVTGNALDINQHTYETFAADSRVRVDYDLGGDTSTLTVGVTAMDIRSPIFTERTAANDLRSDRGPNLRFDALRTSRVAAVFSENLFRFDRFTITPALRLEANEQSMNEKVNIAKSPANLIRDDRSELVPLGGLGATFAATSKTEVYANVSTAYKPPTYGDAFPSGGADTVSSELAAGHVVNTEVGYRGRPNAWASFDASLFHINYKDRFGRVGSNFQNVGESVNQGASLTGEIDFYDLINGPSTFSVSWYSSYQYLDAEFVGGLPAIKGKTPQYAPEHMLRTGLVVQEEQSWKVAALFTHLSDHWADDANTVVPGGADWRIPAYVVLDLTAEARVWSGKVAGRDAEVWLLGGLNNALAETYFSRVRGNGIDPANGRNYYLGLRAEF
jgi:Fe(3+) dicitrate transport protein